MLYTQSHRRQNRQLFHHGSYFPLKHPHILEINAIAGPSSISDQLPLSVWNVRPVDPSLGRLETGSRQQPPPRKERNFHHHTLLDDTSH
jgi:hypothetical protein